MPSIQAGAAIAGAALAIPISHSKQFLSKQAAVRCTDLESRGLDQGPRIHGPGSSHGVGDTALGPRPWLQALGFKALDPARAVDPWPWIQGFGSRAKIARRQVPELA